MKRTLLIIGLLCSSHLMTPGLAGDGGLPSGTAKEPPTSDPTNQAAHDFFDPAPAVATPTQSVNEVQSPPLSPTGATEIFPLPVRLLGFVARADSVSVLIQVGRQRFVLKKGETLECQLAELPQVQRLLFDSIDLENQRLTLAFPASVYRSKDCRMGQVLTGSTQP